MVVRYRAAGRRQLILAASGWWGEDAAPEASSIRYAAHLLDTHINDGGYCAHVLCERAIYPCGYATDADNFLAFLGHGSDRG